MPGSASPRNSRNGGRCAGCCHSRRLNRRIGIARLVIFGCNSYAPPMPKLPTAILFDLDDTILAAFGQPEDQWRRVVAEFADRLEPHPHPDIVAAVQDYSR